MLLLLLLLQREPKEKQEGRMKCEIRKMRDRGAPEGGRGAGYVRYSYCSRLLYVQHHNTVWDLSFNLSRSDPPV
jgi:hypothetical protein